MKRLNVLIVGALLSMTAYAQDTIQAKFSVVDVCEGVETVFTNVSKTPSWVGPCNYSWRFGDGATSTAQFPKHTYKLDDPKKAQSFSVTLIVRSISIPTEVDSMHLSTTVFPVPDPYFTWKVNNKGNTQDVLIDSQATKDASMTYQWTLAGVLKSNDVTPTFVHADVEPYLDGTKHLFALYLVSKEGCDKIYSTTFSYNPLSVKEVVHDGIIGYPNPSNGVVQFDESFSRIEIYTTEGKLLQTRQQTAQVNTVELPKGVYLFMGEKNDLKYFQRLIVQ